MNYFKLTYKPFGNHSILIEWPSKIDDNILHDILRFKKILQKNIVKEKVYIKHAYNSILISYSVSIDNIYSKKQELEQLYISNELRINQDYKIWKIPVCYEDEYALDIEEISNTKKLSKSKIIELHTRSLYTVFFIGFLPGFLYLGGLNNKLIMPRKSTPRKTIKKGDVAIGGNQTGVYPNSSPGGWNIIGNTPINFFNAKFQKPCFAVAGDKIQFIPVSKVEYKNIENLVRNYKYEIESEVINA